MRWAIARQEAAEAPERFTTRQARITPSKRVRPQPTVVALGLRRRVHAVFVNFVSVPIAQSLTVPATTRTGVPVKRLVIDFASGSCVGTGRASQVYLIASSPGAATTSNTGDNFSENLFPLPVAQLAQSVQNATASFAMQVKIMLDPGMTVSIANDITVNGPLRCHVQMSGYFVAQ
jgi:hypothetical protein